MSDTDSSEDIDIVDHLDKFIFDHSESVINLYQELKSRVPYFFGNTCVPLYNIILEQFEKPYIPIKLFDTTFLQKYNTEIRVTLNVINNFLYNIKCKPIHINKWEHFCYNTL